MSQLFTPLRLREIEFRNRVFVSPMCQYSSLEGSPTDWHLVHLGSRAVGGGGLVMVEASAVAPRGRISPWDSGLWNRDQAQAFAPIARFIRQQGAVPAIQLAHAGRKASTERPWRGSGPVAVADGGWLPEAPSPLAFSEQHPVPHELTVTELEELVGQFVASAELARQAGFEVVEVHMAHGYLLHEFLSPLSNRRSDHYGGCLENRLRLPLAVAAAVRAAWPRELPVFVRISASDWLEGGWDLRQSLKLCGELKELGIDLIDCSSAGLTPQAPIPAAPGFQTPFATEIRRQVGIPTGAVGLITAPEQAEQIVACGLADVVLLARELLRNPYWPLHAARTLGAEIAWPDQYLRAKPV